MLTKAKLSTSTCAFCFANMHRLMKLNLFVYEKIFDFSYTIKKMQLKIVAHNRKECYNNMSKIEKEIERLNVLKEEEKNLYEKNIKLIAKRSINFEKFFNRPFVQEYINNKMTIGSPAIKALLLTPSAIAKERLEK